MICLSILITVKPTRVKTEKQFSLEIFRIFSHRNKWDASLYNQYTYLARHLKKHILFLIIMCSSTPIKLKEENHKILSGLKMNSIFALTKMHLFIKTFPWNFLKYFDVILHNYLNYPMMSIIF